MDITILGFVAATLTTLAFLPQTIHSWKTRDLSGISLSMYSLFTVGVVLWIIYAAMIRNWPVLMANVVTLGTSGSILFLKIQSLKKDAQK
ncbi:MAG: SemiSWEET transporter [Betaproteobacteria bacterium]|jgi:MtN3 and saliva related transmembrane protein